MPRETAKHRAGFVTGVALTATLALSAGAARAEPRWLLEGLIDAELWRTDSGSALLSKDAGDSTGESRLQLWSAVEISPRVRVVALGEVEGSTADDGDDGHELELAFVRFGLGRNAAWQLDAGRILWPVGNFSSRHPSNVNPLIGEPTSYAVSYPLGLQLAGTAGLFDLLAGIVDEPLTHERFVPAPDRSLRPVLAVGVTPRTGLRVGGYFTRGSYLNEDVEPLLPAGSDWEDFEQRLIGLDFHYSGGYVEINADYSRGRYDVPTPASELRSEVAFVEVKYTWSPRWFTAVRLGHNRYVRVIPPGPGGEWFAGQPEIDDAEIGVGFRLASTAVLKASYRENDWTVPAFARAHYPDGRAFAVQLSHRFDVRSWFGAAD